LISLSFIIIIIIVVVVVVVVVVFVHFMLTYQSIVDYHNLVVHHSLYRCLSDLILGLVVIDYNHIKFVLQPKKSYFYASNVAGDHTPHKRLEDEREIIKTE
jgi:flagellar basal body-associated protein FliL